MTQEVRIGVDGMSCASCVRRVERAIAQQPGVASASVNLTSATATISYDRADVPALLEAVRKAGYEPRLEHLTLKVHGMTCASCVGRVERALKGLPGVTEASVNLTTESAALTYLPASVSAERIAQTIRAAGYDPEAPAQPAESDEERKQQELAQLKRDLSISAVLTLPLLMISMGAMLVPGLDAALTSLAPRPVWDWAQLALATPVLLWAGRRFVLRGATELRHLSPGMDSLVLVGSGAAYLYSLIALIVPGIFPAGTAHLYFEAAAVIVTLILLGRYFEAVAKGRTSQAIRQLVGLQPKTARIKEGERETEIPADAVVPGDILVMRPGERLPVDGILVAGSSRIDESMISGEPVPVRKDAGDEVIGGTLNQTGGFSYRATRVGADTVLAQIVRLVEDAQSGKPAIQRVADQIAAVFVPAVMGVSLLTFVVWLWLGPAPPLSFAFVAAVSVLLIACPCAMGLATPTAIMVASGRAATLGILFRRGSALETLARIDTLILDKTGTLTEGRPALTTLATFGAEESEALALAAAVERQSEHPIATAIVSAAEERAISIPEATQVSAEPGFGIGAQVGGRTVRVGAERWMERLEVPLEAATETASRLSAEGLSPVYVAADKELIAVLAVSDPIKPSTLGAVRRMRGLGLEVAMITGDGRHTAKAVASRVGIERVLAEVLPADKAAEVKRLQAEGRRVAFVGDGINDAPALAQADVGIAIGTGTDIAVEAGDVILMQGDLRGTVDALALARRTLRTIRINFFWAYAYNVALIPLAAGVFYPLTGWLLSPMLAAGAMSLSSLFVVSNSLRLRRFAPGTDSASSASTASGPTTPPASQKEIEIARGRELDPDRHPI